MDQDTRLQKVIDVLQEKGYTEAQVAEFVQNLTKSNFAKAYAEAMSSLTDEDLAKIEATKTQDEANQVIAELYTLRTGKDPKEEAQRFLDIFCDGFLAEYEKEKEKAQA